MTKEPVLTLLDFIKLFEVDVETFDIAVGGILMQDDHPFAYRSYKLSGVEKRWPTHEKKILVVVYYLQVSEHFLKAAI